MLVILMLVNLSSKVWISKVSLSWISNPSLFGFQILLCLDSKSFFVWISNPSLFGFQILLWISLGFLAWISSFFARITKVIQIRIETYYFFKSQKCRFQKSSPKTRKNSSSWNLYLFLGSHLEKIQLSPTKSLLKVQIKRLIINRPKCVQTV